MFEYYQLIIMKSILYIIFVFLLVFSACKTDKKEIKQEETVAFVSFGDKITTDNTITDKEMAKKFDDLKVGDTINVKFKGKIKAVCQKKGCWIKVPLDTKKESFVKFKDYAFFLPMNSAGSEVILNGKAFKNEISVKQLQHYAQDAGKSEEEIAKIIEPKITYSFLADGVLLEAGAKVDEK